MSASCHPLCATPSKYLTHAMVWRRKCGNQDRSPGVMVAQYNSLGGRHRRYALHQRHVLLCKVAQKDGSIDAQRLERLCILLIPEAVHVSNDGQPDNAPCNAEQACICVCRSLVLDSMDCLGGSMGWKSTTARQQGTMQGSRQRPGSLPGPSTMAARQQAPGCEVWLPNA